MPLDLDLKHNSALAYLARTLVVYCTVARSRRRQLIYLLLARDVIYTSCTYATMSVSVCLSVTEVHWHIIANLGFKFCTLVAEVYFDDDN